jgi:hypothetical protein
MWARPLNWPAGFELIETGHHDVKVATGAILSQIEDQIFNLYKRMLRRFRQFVLIYGGDMSALRNGVQLLGWRMLARKD